MRKENIESVDKLHLHEKDTYTSLEILSTRYFSHQFNFADFLNIDKIALLNGCRIFKLLDTK